MDAPEAEPKREQEAGIGPMAATLVIVMLVALAGVYFFFHENERFHAAPIEEQLNA